MAVETQEALEAKAEEIRDEVVKKNNTALRVGTMLLSLAQTLFQPIKTVTWSGFVQVFTLHGSTSANLDSNFGVGIGINGDSGAGQHNYGRIGWFYKSDADKNFRLSTRSGGVLKERFGVNADGSLIVPKVNSFATPPATWGAFGFKTDGKPYAKNDGGTEYDLTGGTSLGGTLHLFDNYK